MHRPFRITPLYYTWSLLALLTVFSVLQLTRSSLPVTLALRSYADTHPTLLAHTNSPSSEDVSNAEYLLEKASTIQPDNPSIWRARGWLSLAQGLDEQALENWSHVDSATEELIFLADRDLNAGNTDIALEYYNLATALSPDSAEAWNRLALAHTSRSDWRQTAYAYKRAAELDQNNRVYWYRLGDAYVELGDTDNAIDAYTHALSAEPNEIGASQVHYALGLVYDSLDTLPGTETALTHYTNALEQDDFANKSWVISDTYFRRGSIYAKNNRTEKAISDFQNAVQQNPQHYRGYIALASALWKHERQEEAIAALEQAILLRPDASTGRIRLGDYLSQIGDISSAIDQYEEALRLDPDNQGVQKRLTRLQSQTPAP